MIVVDIDGVLFVIMALFIDVMCLEILLHFFW